MKETHTYKSSGVDIDAGNQFVDNIASLCEKTHRPETLCSLGGFAGLSAIPTKYKNPILVSGTDGVGTKLDLLVEHNKHEVAGNDLVAMCLNDIIVTGAEPLFFLDYIATGKLDINTITEVVSGITKACGYANCAVIGGETAEMPGMYANHRYDLAGFGVGVVEKSEIISAEQVTEGDVLIGIESNGPHSNGYSLIRKLLTLSTPSDDILASILAPTHLYTQHVKTLLENKIPIHGMAHITGGGLIENIPRFLPKHLKAIIDLSSWKLSPTFEWIQNTSNLPNEEFHKTFNCGIGFVLCIPEASYQSTLQLLQTYNLNTCKLGYIHQENISSFKEPTLVLESDKSFKYYNT